MLTSIRFQVLKVKIKDDDDVDDTQSLDEWASSQNAVNPFNHVRGRACKKHTTQCLNGGDGKSATFTCMFSYHKICVNPIYWFPSDRLAQNEKPPKLFMAPFVHHFFIIIIISSFHFRVALVAAPHSQQINIVPDCRANVMMAAKLAGDEIPFESNHSIFDTRRVTNQENKHTKCFQPQQQQQHEQPKPQINGEEKKEN